MLAQPDPLPKSLFKNPKLYTSAALVLVILVVGWTLVSRWLENRAIENRSREERSEKQREQDRITLEQLGGKELAIQNFYAMPGEIRRGKPFNCATAWPTPRPSSSSLNPIPFGPPIRAAST